MSKGKRIAILGGGPTGIEAALFAARRGFDVHLYELGEIGAHVANWGHVTLFSPWELNRSPWGEDLLREKGIALGEDGVFPTGNEFLEQYLEPLSKHELLEGRVHTNHEVLGVSRKHALKGDFIANPERDVAPFLLHIKNNDDEFYAEADIVIDATGSYRHPNALGPGGLPALGELGAGEAIERYVPDVLGADRDVYAGKQTLVIGAGYSAVTTVKSLEALAAREEGTRVFWLMRSEESPYDLIDNDPLPQRSELAEFGNAASKGLQPHVSPLLGSYLYAIKPTGEGRWKVEIQEGGETRTLEVDHIISNVGYRPDNNLTRELQVHLCYASEGPMKLAASLLSAGGGGDCLAQSSAGVDTLRNPEPNLFVLGAKSYGRNSAYLLKLGIEQIGEVATLWEDAE